MLAVDLSHVGDIEWILLPGATGSGINAVCFFPQDIQNPILRCPMRTDQVTIAMIAALETLVTIDTFLFGNIYIASFEKRRCHNHAKTLDGNNRDLFDGKRYSMRRVRSKKMNEHSRTRARAV